MAQVDFPWDVECETFVLPEACGTVILMSPADCGLVLLLTEGGPWLFHPDTRTLTEYSATRH